MPSTYTSNTGIEKPATGEQSGTWGDTVNTNSDILDRALNGVGSIALSGTTHTLTTTDGTLSDGMYRVLVFGGTPSGTNTVTISPNDAQKLYFVQNDSGQSVVLTQGTGTDVTVPDGEKAIVYADGGGAGANVVSLSADLTGVLVASNNLSDLADSATALTNLGLTATAAEINYNDITTLGTSQASKVVTADANGVVTFDAGVVEDDTAITSSAGAATINCRDGNSFSHTLSENVTYTFSNAPASGRAFGFVLKVVQDSTARTITWPSSVDWPAATAPTLSTGSGEVDVFVFYTIDGGTTWYGFTSGQALG